MLPTTCRPLAWTSWQLIASRAVGELHDVTNYHCSVILSLEIPSYATIHFKPGWFCTDAPGSLLVSVSSNVPLWLWRILKGPRALHTVCEQRLANTKLSKTSDGDVIGLLAHERPRFICPLIPRHTH